MSATTSKPRLFEFLMVARDGLNDDYGDFYRDPDTEGVVTDRMPRGRKPAGAWRDSGTWLYSWTTRAHRLDTAVRRAGRRCRRLRDLTGLDWCVDEDVHVDGRCDRDHVAYVGNHPAIGDVTY